MNKENEIFPLVPLHIHHCNAAERAIQTFKNHFIAGLVSTHKEFLFHLWCRPLPQAVVAFNLLDNLVLILKPRRMHNYMVNLITTQHHFPCPKQK